MIMKELVMLFLTIWIRNQFVQKKDFSFQLNNITLDKELLIIICKIVNSFYPYNLWKMLLLQTCLKIKLWSITRWSHFDRGIHQFLCSTSVTTAISIFISHHFSFISASRFPFFYNWVNFYLILRVSKDSC